MPKNFSATRPVNPSGAEPKLTINQLWEGLEAKARNPIGFVPDLASSVVLEDTGDKVVREVVSQSGVHVQEQIRIYKPTIIYFEAPKEGIHITNLVSYDIDNELQLTFSFAGGIPGGPPDFGEGIPAEEISRQIGQVIEKSVERIRENVRIGFN